MTTETKTIEARAFLMSVGDITTGDNGDNSKSAPVTIRALSGKPIDHWYWGQVVHDIEGMVMVKDRIAVDYCHDARDIVGYVKRADNAPDGALMLTGALTPFGESDRATEIIAKKKMGVPYEASVDFTPSKPGDMAIEQYDAGVTVMVNGQELNGPLTVIRKSVLRGVAICPYGADRDTETIMGKPAGQTAYKLNVTRFENDKKEQIQMNEDKPVDGAALAEVPALIPEGETESTTAPIIVTVPVVTTVEGAAIATAPEAEKELARFNALTAEFGTANGAEFFKLGMSIEDARKQDCDDAKKECVDLRAEVATLTARVAELAMELKAATTTTPVAFSPSGSTDLWTQYQKITDPREKTKFYRANKEQMR